MIIDCHNPTHFLWFRCRWETMKVARIHVEVSGSVACAMQNQLSQVWVVSEARRARLSAVE